MRDLAVLADLGDGERCLLGVRERHAHQVRAGLLRLQQRLRARSFNVAVEPPVNPRSAVV